jgi:putative FmdB family regulatory protein
MPIYEYNCDKCGVFEVTQRITEKPLDVCPTCGGSVKRLISHTSFVLKGSGWYVTDYARSANAKGENSTDSAAKTDTAGESGDKNGTSKASDTSTAGSSGPSTTPASTPSKPAD